jgi:hypothetical protein
METNQKTIAVKESDLADIFRKIGRVALGKTRQVISLCKFWVHDVWLEGWDHERRILLFKHYWSYFRYSPIPTEHLPESTARGMAEQEQIEFSGNFRKKIAYVQARAEVSKGVYLSFRPIGKNLRLLATAVRDNVDHHRKTFIRNGGPPTEERALSMDGYQWCPWLWSRTANYGMQTEGERRDTAKAWNIFFQEPSSTSTDEGTVSEPQVSRLKRTFGPFGSSYLERVLKNAASLTYLFSPVESVRLQVEAWKEKIQWPKNGEPVLGVHIRRGDAASSGIDGALPQKATRKSFAITEYLDAMDVICRKYEIRHVYLATESLEEIERAKRLRPQYTFLYLEHDRSIFPDIASSNKFIEYMAFDHPERVPALTMSAILDLCFFRECHAFIGTFNSEFSILGWLLMVGARGHIVPHISLSKPMEGRSLNPFNALLNVRNNCPLELYHW